MVTTAFDEVPFSLAYVALIDGPSATVLVFVAHVGVAVAPTLACVAFVRSTAFIPPIVALGLPTTTSSSSTISPSSTSESNVSLVV